LPGAFPFNRNAFSFSECSTIRPTLPIAFTLFPRSQTLSSGQRSRPGDAQKRTSIKTHKRDKVKRFLRENLTPGTDCVSSLIPALRTGLFSRPGQLRANAQSLSVGAHGNRRIATAIILSVAEHEFFGIAGLGWRTRSIHLLSQKN
jgi:hypothetical protein